MNTWNCTRCNTPHAAPALVMSESGLPFCNDLCKTAYERDSEVDEMCAQFDEARKRIAEWGESRQAVFNGLRIDHLLRRESELTASVHELLAIAELAAFYLPGELGEQSDKVHAAIERAQALVNEESYNVR